MAVCLRKPDDHIREYTPMHLIDEVITTESTSVREYTPIHICDEVCPASVASKTQQSLADYLHTAIIRVINEDIHNLVILSELFDLPDPYDVSEKDLAVRNGRVIYVTSTNPLFNSETVYTSKLLDSLQSLLEYLEQPSANFNGLCNCLRTTWIADENKFYQALCEFLADVKHGDVQQIEEVLQEEGSCCYTSLMLGGETSEMDSFLAHVNTKLFSSLYELLARETGIRVHPLFLFVCKNFCAERHADDDDWRWTRKRAGLQSYARSLEGSVLPEPKKIPKFFLNVEVCSDAVPFVCFMSMLASLSVSIISCLTGGFLEGLYIPWFVLSLASLVSLKVVPCLVDRKYYHDQMLERHEGLRHFLAEHRNLNYVVPDAIKCIESQLFKEPN